MNLSPHPILLQDKETLYCVDARHYGNVARFINHGCDANLTPVKVFIDHQDLSFPRMSFFANRDIRENEELTYVYSSCSPFVQFILQPN